jgi:hypothetical protein
MLSSAAVVEAGRKNLKKEKANEKHNPSYHSGQHVAADLGIGPCDGGWYDTGSVLLPRLHLQLKCLASCGWPV